MTTKWENVARTCLEGAESGTMTFPQIVGTLIEAGFDGYAVDLRRATAIYYLRTAKPSNWKQRGPNRSPSFSTRPRSRKRSARPRPWCRATPTRASAPRWPGRAARATWSHFWASGCFTTAAPARPTPSIFPGRSRRPNHEAHRHHGGRNYTRTLPRPCRLSCAG